MDLTCVVTRQLFGFVACAIDAFARLTVGLRVTPSLKAELALDAHEQAAHAPADAVGRYIKANPTRSTCRSAEANAWPNAASTSWWRNSHTGLSGEAWTVHLELGAHAEGRQADPECCSPLRNVPSRRRGRFPAVGQAIR